MLPLFILMNHSVPLSLIPYIHTLLALLSKYIPNSIVVTFSKERFLSFLHCEPFFSKHLLIYLRWSLRRALGSLVVVFSYLRVNSQLRHGIQFPDQGNEPRPHFPWECGVLTPGPPGSPTLDILERVILCCRELSCALL